MGYRVLVNRTVDPDADPRGGFFGDLFHAVSHVVGGAIGGLVSGGPVGGIVGAVGGTVSAISEAAGSSSGGSDAGVPPTPMLPPPSAAGAGVGIVPAGAMISPLGTVGGSGARAKLAAGQAKGFHMNKSWGFSRKTKAILPPNSHLVRNRRMNWGNGKALSRAGRRIHAFLHHARKFYSMAHPHHKGTMAFKFKRGKKR